MPDLKIPTIAFAKEHATVDYYNKLSGKSIADSRFFNDDGSVFVHSKVLYCIKSKKTNVNQDFPDELCFLLENKTELILSYIVVMELIEGGMAMDQFGHCYQIVPFSSGSITKVKCDCRCHSENHILHIKPCCDNGWKYVIK